MIYALASTRGGTDGVLCGTGTVPLPTVGRHDAHVAVVVLPSHTTVLLTADVATLSSPLLRYGVLVVPPSSALVLATLHYEPCHSPLCFSLSVCVCMCVARTARITLVFVLSTCAGKWCTFELSFFCIHPQWCPRAFHTDRLAYLRFEKFLLTCATLRSRKGFC